MTPEVSEYKYFATDFTGIDLYPIKYKTKKTKYGRSFGINTLVIEDISRQQAKLIKLGGHFTTGGSIRLDTTFGHYDSKVKECEDPNLWLTVPLKGEFKVLKMIATENNQIILKVQPHKFKLEY